MALGRGIALVVLVIVAGLIVGSFLGEVLGSQLPAGRARDLVSKGPTIGLTPPASLDLHFLAVTFGISLKVNLVGVLGIVIAALVLRKL